MIVFRYYLIDYVIRFDYEIDDTDNVLCYHLKYLLIYYWYYYGKTYKLHWVIIQNGKNEHWKFYQHSGIKKYHSSLIFVRTFQKTWFI